MLIIINYSSVFVLNGKSQGDLPLWGQRECGQSRDDDHGLRERTGRRPVKAYKTLRNIWFQP